MAIHWIPGLLNYLREYLERRELELEIIQVHQLLSEALITADYTNETIVKATQSVEESNGVIFISPVYKAAYSGILKTFIDLLPQKGLKNKSVLPLALGGTYGHLLVIDYVLKPVLLNLGTTNIYNGVYVLDKQVTKKEDGSYLLDEDSKGRLNIALEMFRNSVKE